MSGRNEAKQELRFGTSGLRDLVSHMTDKEVYINTIGFLTYLKQCNKEAAGSRVALAGDYRSSTERIMKAVARGIVDSNLKVDHCGRIPSPALFYYAMQQAIPSIMVTGSHIPDDRNGVKFAKAEGEILKQEELPILNCVADVRKQINVLSPKEPHFDASGYFNSPITIPPINHAAADQYLKRYLDIFPNNCLARTTVAVYQHSAVGRDMLITLLEKLGAKVIAPHDQILLSYDDEDLHEVVSGPIDLRSEKFVPVDTEKITVKTKAVLSYLQKKYEPDFIVSMDGDSDRPLVADEQSRFLPGDQLGLLSLLYLGPQAKATFLALPVSTNDGVISKLERMGYTVRLTKIGSPYIVAEMLAAVKGTRGEHFKYTMGWEANGGFLLGSSVMINHTELPALPTRDAVLPIITVMLLAKRKRMSASQLFKTMLLPRYTIAGIVDDKTPGLEHYTAELGRQLIHRFIPKAVDIMQCNFRDKRCDIINGQGKTIQIQPGGAAYDELYIIKQELEKQFNDIGLKNIRSINFIDGIRIVFARDNVVYHLRPSGNAPEFRSYVTADTPHRAESVLRKRTLLIRLMLDTL
jgi:phosphomannomutase